MTMRIEPATPWLGAMVTGIDAGAVTEEQGALLIRALADHGVLVFRDQQLSPDALVAFAGRLGPVEYNVRELFLLPENRNVYVISNIVENGKPIGNPNDGFAWHTDLSFLAEPTAYTCLYAIETPPEGAETQFASAFRTFEALDPAEQARLSAIKVRHSYEMMHATRKWATPLTEEEKARLPDVLHPLVRTHPVNGRKAFYLGINTSLPEGMDEEEGYRLIADLLAETTRPDYVFSHSWRPGDLVVWDNRGLQHRATDYDRERYRRLIYRVTVKGERPV